MRKVTINTLILILGLAGVLLAGTNSDGTNQESDIHQRKVNVGEDTSGIVQLPATGQITQHHTDDDGQLQKGIGWPSPRFTDNNDGTIKDNLTGLIWLKNGDCSESVVTWDEALGYINELNTTGTMNGNDAGDTSKAGSHQTDWRLPNRNELESLINLEQANMKTWLEANGFTSIVSGRYWTSTTFHGDTTHAWHVQTTESRVRHWAKDVNTSVWAVRGETDGSSAELWRTGQKVSYAAGDDGDLQKGTAWPDPRFTDNGDGTVTDNLTNLIWLMNANCAQVAVDWNTAFDYINELNSNGTMNGNDAGDTSNSGSHQTDWRLPNRKELFSLADIGTYQPNLPSEHPFQEVQDLWYWSSSTYSINTANGWELSIGSGSVSHGSKSDLDYVWPVRDENSQGGVSSAEIDVRGNYLSIADGDTTPSADDSTSFGSTAVDGGTVDKTFKIFNTGNGRLYLSMPDNAELTMKRSTLNQSGPSVIVTISGDHSDEFEVTTQPSVLYLEPGDSTSFSIQFDPSAGGTRSATVSIPNNDSDESPFNFAIEGIGITAPTVTTATVDSITVISAEGGGHVTASGGDSVTVRGVCWGLAENPTVDSSHTTNGAGTGEFSSSITGLAHGTTYHVRAYATNSAGTGYGDDREFTTKEITVSITPADTLLRGDQTVTYKVNIENVLPAIRGYSVNISFNSDHFLSPEFNQSTFLSSTGDPCHWETSGSDGVYTIDCAILGDTEGKTGDGVLFNITLTTADTVLNNLVNPESANLAIASVTLRDVNNLMVACDTTKGATVVIDTAPPTIEEIVEADSVWYRSQPTFSNFGFDDNYNLDDIDYKINSGDWESIKENCTSAAYDLDGAGLPDYSGLEERTAPHFIYTRASDDAGNQGGYDLSWHWCFRKDETEPQGNLELSFTEVSTTGMHVKSEPFADATQGEEYYQFDCTTGEAFDRARTLADSIHECTGMTPNTQYTFKYQVSDGVTDPNATPAYNATSWSSAYSKYTLSVAPTTSTVTCDKSGTISTTTLTFTAVGGFGAGKIEYYRYAFNANSQHTFTDAETKWSSGNVLLGIPTANTNYYFHVKGFNGEDSANGTLTLGPFQWDGTPISPVTELNFKATGSDSNSISMDWTNPQNDAHFIEIWLKGYGTYPEYVGAVPDFPKTPAEASNANWFKIQDSLTTNGTFTMNSRNFYYCAVFVEDLAEHYSAAVIDSSLSYWLGDVNATPDGEVDAADIAILASAFGTVDGGDYWNNVCDVGPTTNYGRISRPVPDDAIDFEDLMVFAMNYENTGIRNLKKSAIAKATGPVTLKLSILKGLIDIQVKVELENNDGFVKGLNIPLHFNQDLALYRVDKGELWGDEDFFMTQNNSSTCEINSAKLKDMVIAGNGTVARLTFTISGDNPDLQISDAIARYADNTNIEVAYAYTEIESNEFVEIPTEYKLHQNYPNPFNPSTTIRYDLKENGLVKISLFNITGQRIQTIFEGVKPAGYHSYIFEADRITAGVYFYQIEVNQYKETHKMLIIK